ncbi:MAG: GNAT family N-acetyltransferase [Candidatus Obscuribacterales bacterium]|jgi:ribosomal protein S18 acetylase RimI-like enzyme
MTNIPANGESKAQVTYDIRDAEENEREAMLNVTLAAYREFEVNADANFWQLYEKNIAQAINEGPDIERIVYLIDKKIVASVLLCKQSFNSPEPEIRLLAVDPAYRQKGIAKALMNECERRLAERGHKQVVLHTTSLMQTAREMYERNGYTRYEKIDFSPVPEFIVIGFIKNLV